MPEPTPPAWRQPRLVGLVLLGGALGTLARYAVTLALPTRPGDWPTATLCVNLAGAFLLGLLLEALRSGPDRGRRRDLRLLVGTGLLGAFTTYSSLAVDTDQLVRTHHAGLAATYALVTVVAGLIATLAGLLAGGARGRWHTGGAAAVHTRDPDR